MAAPDTSSGAVTITLTEEERTLLSSILDQMLRDKRVEIHRTDALEYREHLERQETLLSGLIGKLRRPAVV